MVPGQSEIEDARIVSFPEFIESASPQPPSFMANNWFGKKGDMGRLASIIDPNDLDKNLIHRWVPYWNPTKAITALEVADLVVGFAFKESPDTVDPYFYCASADLDAVIASIKGACTRDAMHLTVTDSMPEIGRFLGQHGVHEGLGKLRRF